MRKPIFYYLAGVLSVIAVLAALWGFGLLLGSALNFGGGGSDVKVLVTVPSPDREYVATTYVVMGGGAAGWCYKRVSVSKKSEPFSWEKEKERGGFSFDVSCGSEVELKWEGNRELVVAYTGSDNDAGISVYQRPVSEDRGVKIKYVAK